MKSLGGQEADDEARVKAALFAFATTVGTSPVHAVLTTPILMPMHLAVDAVPLIVSSSNADADSFFLKSYTDDAMEFVNLAATVAASEQANQLGIGPQLLAYHEPSSSLLYSLLPPKDWRMATRKDMDSSSTLEAVLAVKRAWHASSLLPLSRSPFETIARYCATIEQLAASTVDSESRLHKPAGFQTLLAWISRIEQSFRASGTDVGPIHGENALSNVMLSQGDVIRLVDFDRATNADPHYDLAGLCLEFCSFYDQVEETVSLYLGAPDSKVSARTALYMIVDDFLWGCWSLIEHYSSHRSNTIEFYKYAQNRFLRCRYWLNRWDIATLQRRM